MSITFRNDSQTTIEDATVDELIDVLSSLPAEIRSRPILTYEGGSIKPGASVLLWRDSSGQVTSVVIDAA